MTCTPFLRMPYLQNSCRQALFQSWVSATMHSAQRPSLKAPASESERRGRVLPPPSPLKHAPCTMMNTTLPTDPATTRVQELTLSLPGRAGTSGNNLPTDTEVLFFALQIVQRAETAAEAKVWAQEVLRFSGGSTEADVWPPPGAAEWKGKSSKPAPLYARMEKAYKSVWGFWELESICLAMSLARRGAM